MVWKRGIKNWMSGFMHRNKAVTKNDTVCLQPTPNGAYMRYETWASLVQTIRLSTLRHHITWNNDDYLIMGPLGTNTSEALIKILTFSARKMHLVFLSAKWRPFFRPQCDNKRRLWTERLKFKVQPGPCPQQSHLEPWDTLGQHYIGHG